MAKCQRQWSKWAHGSALEQVIRGEMGMDGSSEGESDEPEVETVSLSIFFMVIMPIFFYA